MITVEQIEKIQAGLVSGKSACIIGENGKKKLKKLWKSFAKFMLTLFSQRFNYE